MTRAKLPACLPACLPAATGQPRRLNLLMAAVLLALSGASLPVSAAQYTQAIRGTEDEAESQYAAIRSGNSETGFVYAFQDGDEIVREKSDTDYIVGTTTTPSSLTLNGDISLTGTRVGAANSVMTVFRGIYNAARSQIQTIKTDDVSIRVTATSECQALDKGTGMQIWAIGVNSAYGNKTELGKLDVTARAEGAVTAAAQGVSSSVNGSVDLNGGAMDITAVTSGINTLAQAQGIALESDGGTITSTGAVNIAARASGALAQAYGVENKNMASAAAEISLPAATIAAEATTENGEARAYGVANVGKTTIGAGDVAVTATHAGANGLSVANGLYGDGNGTLVKGVGNIRVTAGSQAVGIYTAANSSAQVTYGGGQITAATGPDGNAVGIWAAGADSAVTLAGDTEINAVHALAGSGVVAVDAGTTTGFNGSSESFTGHLLLRGTAGLGMSFAETEQHVRADDAAALIFSAGTTLNGTYIVGTDAVEPSTAGIGSALRLLSDGTLVIVVDDGFENDAALVTVDDVSAEQGARVRLVNTAYLADGTIVFKTNDPITDLDYTLETDSLFTDIVNNTIVKKAADAVFGGTILIPNVVDEALASPSEAGERIIGMTSKGQSIEAASRALNRFALLSAAGGSQIAALSATSLVDDAVVRHAADARAKTSLWVDVRGSSMQAGSFSAGSTTYGVKSDLYGATVGIDFASSQETSIGLALSAGSGSVRGQKTGAGTKNDVDYWGVNLYGTYSMGAWGELTASIGYLQTSNDLAQDELSADPNVSAYSASVRYAKTFETAPGVTVTPHAGVRWTYLDADDFIAGGMSYESEKVHLAAFPLGATVAKTFETPSGWRLAPYLDLEVAPQVGDTKTDNVVSISGGSTEDVIDTRIASSVVYSARIGVSGDFSEAHAFGFSAGISAGNEGYSSQYVKASYRFAF